MHCSQLLFLAQAVPFAPTMDKFTLQTAGISLSALKLTPPEYLGVWMSQAQEEHCRGRQLYEAGLALNSAFSLDQMILSLSGPQPPHEHGMNNDIALARTGSWVSSHQRRHYIVHGAQPIFVLSKC